MGLFDTKEEKRRLKEIEQRRQAEVIVAKLGLSDLPEEDRAMVIDLASSMGIDSFFYPAWQLTKARSKAEEQQMKWQWLQTRQNWLILNQLAKLNKNMEELIALEKSYMD